MFVGVFCLKKHFTWWVFLPSLFLNMFMFTFAMINIWCCGFHDKIESSCMVKGFCLHNKFLLHDPLSTLENVASPLVLEASRLSLSCCPTPHLWFASTQTKRIDILKCVKKKYQSTWESILKNISIMHI